MEETQKQDIYFIFCEKGTKNTVKKMELSLNNSLVKIEEEKVLNNNYYILYHLILPNNYKENLIPLSLTYDSDKNNEALEYYMSYIQCKKDEIFKYNLIFDPVYDNSSYCLNQIFLPILTQFNIFHKMIPKNEDKNFLISLFLNTIDYISETKTYDIESEFFVSFFIEIDKLKESEEKKKILINFFEKINFVKIFENYATNSEMEKSNITVELLKILKNSWNKLINFAGDNEKMCEKIDVFIMFYLFYKNPEFFFCILFGNKEENFEKIKNHLLANKKIFKNFNSEVLNSSFFFEAPSNYLLLLIKSFIPSMQDVLAIFTDDFFISIYFQKLGNKAINILELCSPRNTDEPSKFIEYMKKVYDNQMWFPIQFDKIFFFKYCELYKNNDYKKIYSLYKFLELYNKRQKIKIKIEENIIKYYHETGIYLIKQKELFNLEMLNFLQNDEFLSDENKEKKLKDIIKIISSGIHFIQKDFEFINNIFNNKPIGDFNVKNFFGKLYGTFIENILNKITSPEHLINLVDCKITWDAPVEVLENFILMIERVWSAHPVNFPDNIKIIIAQSFAYSSFKPVLKETFHRVYKSLENKIPKDILLSTYSILLFHQYDTSEEFREYIINYIKNNCGKNALSVWYLFSILSDENENVKIEFLKNNLKDEFIVKAEDFVGQSIESKEKLRLFQYLRASKYLKILLLYSIETSYYQNSLNSINGIFNLKFKDAIHIYKKNYDFTDIFFYFTPIEKDAQEAELYINQLQIKFSEKCEPLKKFYDLLWCIYNYFEFFFPNYSKDEMNKLKNIISDLDNSCLDDFNNKIKDYQFYIDEYIKEAQDGEKLKNSLFFIAIYDNIRLKNDKINEKERYSVAKNKFNELKNLGIDSDINRLNNDLKEILVEAIHKNIVRLNNELNFINNYFFSNTKQKENVLDEKVVLNKYNNFNTKKIKRQFLKLVKQLEKDKENKEFEIIDEEEKEKDNTNDIIDDVKNTKTNSQKIIMEEKKKLIEKMYKLKQDYIKISKYICQKSNERIKETLKEKFQNYFKNLFEINFGFAKLENEFKDKIINYSKEIFMNNIDIELLSEEKIFILISEFFDILEQFERNGKNSPKIILTLLQYINEFQTNYEYNKISNILSDLFSFILDNINKEDSIYLLIKILIKEAKRGNKEKIYEELLKLILLKKNITNYQFLYEHLSPFIDAILGKEFTECLNLDSNNDNNKISLNFQSSCFSIIENIYEDKIKIEEMLLYYFETKLTNLLLTNSNQDSDLFDKKSKKYKYLEYFLTYLEDLILSPHKHHRNNLILKIYAIAYIKSFYSIQVKYLYNNYFDNMKYRNIFQELYDGKINNFKISMMIYILKLTFDLIGNIYDFAYSEQFQFKNLRMIFNTVIKKLKEANYYEFDYLFDNEYGFDFFTFPGKNADKFITIFNYIIKSKNQNKYNEDLETNINKFNDIDSFYCFLLNVRFSFYYQNYSFNKNEELMKFIEQMINNNKLMILKNNALLKDTLDLLIKTEKYKSKILKEINSMTHDKLFCILMSFRYVLNIIQFNNIEGLFFNLIIDPQNTFNNNKQILNLYLNEKNKEQRDINNLTYKIIRYIIYSHLYISNLLEKINLEIAYEILGIKLKDDEENSLLLELNKEIKSIKNDLNSLGIKNIIIFMNSIFDEVIDVIKIIKINLNNEEELKTIEQNLDGIIKNKIASYKTSLDDYYSLFEKINNNKNENEIDSDTIYSKVILFHDILFEKSSVYNNKNIENELPYLSYLTYTNSCNLDDFKNQYLIENDTKSYPLIDCILKENKILKIIKFIPELNNFVNEYYNKLLSMNITEEDANKSISYFLPNVHDFNKINKSLKNILELLGDDKFDMEIKKESKISEIININSKENKLFKIYNWIIDEYNKFYESINIYEEKKKYIKEVIIQNCTENEYITLINNGKSIQERLKEIIHLYSRRDRIYEDKTLNVYDGGKIIYDFELIEDMLENEFILCKRKFSKTQKLFIFSDKIFSNERNKILLDLNDKYPQIEINAENIKRRISSYLNNDDNIKKSLYYNCIYVIIYLMTYLKNEKFKGEETKIEYIIKLMQKENNIMNETFILLIENSYFNINQILSLYEIIEENVFDVLTKKLKEKIIEDKVINIPEEKENETTNEINKTSLIKEDLLMKGLKKYIVRYYLGDNEGDNNILNNIKLDDIFNKLDIWNKNIFNEEKFNEDKNKLCSINEDNCLLYHLFMKIFNIELEDNISSSDDPDLFD